MDIYAYMHLNIVVILLDYSNYVASLPRVHAIANWWGVELIQMSDLLVEDVDRH